LIRVDGSDAFYKMAWRLVGSGVPFPWVVCPSLVAGGEREAPLPLSDGGGGIHGGRDRKNRGKSLAKTDI
jgi:hypothetical protein